MMGHLPVKEARCSQEQHAMPAIWLTEHLAFLVVLWVTILDTVPSTCFAGRVMEDETRCNWRVGTETRHPCNMYMYLRL